MYFVICSFEERKSNWVGQITVDEKEKGDQQSRSFMAVCSKRTWVHAFTARFASLRVLDSHIAGFRRILTRHDFQVKTGSPVLLSEVNDWSPFYKPVTTACPPLNSATSRPHPGVREHSLRSLQKPTTPIRMYSCRCNDIVTAVIKIGPIGPE